MGMTFSGYDKSEPYWLIKMRQTAQQRPRTRFVKIRGIELHHLLRERDALWEAATPTTRERLLAQRAKDNYGARDEDVKTAGDARAEKPGGLRHLRSGSTRCSSRLAFTENLRMLMAQWGRVPSGITR